MDHRYKLMTDVFVHASWTININSFITDDAASQWKATYNAGWIYRLVGCNKNIDGRLHKEATQPTQAFSEDFIGFLFQCYVYVIFFFFA